MKIALISSLLFAGVADGRPTLADLRALQAFGAVNTDCTQCFDKIDSARDCLRECNQKAYPGDNCCCCCDCEGSGGNNCHNNNQNDKCDDQTFIDNNGQEQTEKCDWELDKQSDNNKWYDIEKYCKCDQGSNNNGKDNCDRNSNLKENDDDRSLLDFCLGDDSPKSVEDIQDLSVCCDFDDSKCDDYFAEVQECLIGCLNPCLVLTAANWLDCIQDNANDGSCSRQECLNGFLEDLPDETGVEGEDIFDLKSLEKRIDKINTDELKDCSLLEDFVDETCNVGDSCCDKCQSQLGASVDCLINDIVFPFAAGALNITAMECPIDTEKCEPMWDRRELTQAEADKFNKAMLLPHRKEANKESSPADNNRVLEGETSTTGQSSSEAAAEACQRQMEINIMSYNMSYAVNAFMSCLMSAGYEALGSADSTTATTTTTSAAAAAFQLFSVLSAMVFAALF